MQLLCDSATRPASCKGLVFKDYLQALSSLHFGCSDGRLLARVPVRHAVLRDDRGMRGLLPKLRECLRARESTPNGGRARIRIFRRILGFALEPSWEFPKLVREASLASSKA